MAMNLSFNFTQQIEWPHMVYQPRKLYFQFLLYFNLFRVMNVGIYMHTNFIFPKGDTKKGTNFVTSRLDCNLTHTKDKY